MSIRAWIIDPLLTLLYPPHCAVCHAMLERGAFVCASCLGGAQRIHEPRCAQCSQPFQGAIEQSFTCSNCDGRKLHFDCAVAAYQSRGIVRDLVLQFKYQREFHLRHPLGDWLVEGFADPRLGAPLDYLVPVPLHPTRERERQFNQAMVLAKIASERTRTPVLPCLQRVRKTPTQTRLDREERMENLLNAFQMRNNRSVQGKHLVLIDDVFTTGSTVNECARVLKRAGAASVRALTVARG